VKATEAPSLHISSIVALPMPAEPPVMIATFPLKRSLMACLSFMAKYLRALIFGRNWTMSGNHAILQGPSLAPPPPSKVRHLAGVAYLH
jgi:hypothetical protein